MEPVGTARHRRAEHGRSQRPGEVESINGASWVSDIDGKPRKLSGRASGLPGNQTAHPTFKSSSSGIIDFSRRLAAASRELPCEWQCPSRGTICQRCGSRGRRDRRCGQLSGRCGQSREGHGQSRERCGQLRGRPGQSPGTIGQSPGRRGQALQRVRPVAGTTRPVARTLGPGVTKGAAGWSGAQAGWWAIRLGGWGTGEIIRTIDWCGRAQPHGSG